MRCARGADITFHAKLFDNTVFRYKMTNKIRQTTFMKMLYMIIAFTFSTHKRERKGKIRDLQYNNKHILKFTFPVCILGCYPFV